MQKICFVSATFPPWVCGIGDHTANLAAELAKSVRVKVLTARAAPPEPPPGVEVEQVFDLRRPGSAWEIASAVASEAPDWVVVQYDPHSYGLRYGIDPFVPTAVALLRKMKPQVRVAIIGHETVATATDWRSALMSSWQRGQLFTLGRAADVMVFPVEQWARRFSGWFPGKRIVHLPVGSNLPDAHGDRESVRSELGIAPTDVVLGLFGRVGATRQLHFVRGALEAVTRTGRRPVLLYLGLEAEAARRTFADVSLVADGPLRAEEISRRFSAMDVYLVPITEGVSARRTSLMGGLQHGIATVATAGPPTDDLLRREDGSALLLADIGAPARFGDAVALLAGDTERREQLGRSGRALFEREFTWRRIASRLYEELEISARG